MQNAPKPGDVSLFRRIWKVARWVLLVLVVLYVGAVVYSIPHVLEKRKTEEVVARIHAQKLIIENVNGEHLPPPPDPAQVDATVEGIDANQNGIRDDVEIAIFKKYPNFPLMRAAELQYAMALQTELTQVFNAETWIAAIQEKGRGFGCVFNVSNGDAGYPAKVTEVENLVRNTASRKEKHSELNKYRTSFKVLSGADCDVNSW
ncbi:hypothetical protein A3D71_03980 [Candidatus Kaiserbacteria bacterium RIFCSPHIGHO2_02_FULL_55_20]|uniref:Uncharacterized protein n=1 Tax=Candidatus Kaiserbacteria bacterium RIFCSPHIGHO2_02_FULL_55_20 TaxID=1798497 RepID=A0A1F6DY37_9BACT|nr:MAG: hypothetical protein A3D71_03980 [Candidatus Kaiserbacteria bacterium RIFCSPHIGHO2_02_FULL_55_20]